MAIDTRSKRASVAGLSLAFLGASIVPDGTIGQQDRQTVGNSYYGIASGGAFVQIGATSQLEAVNSSGSITLERVIGSTSQIEPFNSSGGITIEGVATVENSGNGVNRTLGFEGNNRVLTFIGNNRKITSIGINRKTKFRS